MEEPRYSLSRKRITRAQAFISNYIKDLTLGTNTDNIAHAIGSPEQTYDIVKSKLSLVLYYYLYFGWDKAEIECVFGDL